MAETVGGNTADGNLTAMAGRGHLRASHADREQMVDTLKVAFTQGRLAKDEFDVRISQALVSRTYADLAAVVVGIPAELGAASAAAQGVPAAVEQRSQVGDIRADYSGHCRRGFCG